MTLTVDCKTGCFVAVVGPSGAGKDTVLDAARIAFADDPHIHFVRRVITRPQKPGTEDHATLDESAFAQAIEQGEFALHWQAHGLSYGLPCALEDHLEQGKIVIANVSRRVLNDIRLRYPSRSVVVVTAQADVLAKRLAARGRESEDEIKLRLARRVESLDEADDIFTIDNSGSVQSAINLFINHIMSIDR